jgi:release factor glutamine methyltransferase
MAGYKRDMKTIGELIDRAEEIIRASKAVDLYRPSDARINAEELLEGVLGISVTQKRLDDPVPEAKRLRFEKWVARRAAGEPAAMITGKIDFMGLELVVPKDVFIPRNSSELLAQKAIARLRARRRPVAVDVATGTGPVALAVAHRLRSAKVIGLDIAPRPLAVARRNAARLGIRNVRFLKSNLLAGLDSGLRRKVDVLTSHPPYVARGDLHELPVEIRKFEPVESLTDESDDGLGLVRLLAAQATGWLRPGGWVMVEVSPNLSRSVRGILIRSGFRRVRSLRDSLGATRVISGTTPR